MWRYQSPIGLLVIKRREDGRYVICYQDEIYGSWHSPDAAASDVYTHTTGCLAWDLLDGQVFDAPSDISEWERV